MSTNRNDINGKKPRQKKASKAQVISKSQRMELERKKSLRKKSQKKEQRKRALASFFILIFLLIAFAGIYAISFIFGLKTDNLGGGIEPYGNEPLNILVLGMDVGDAEQEGNDSIRRTDTIMVFNYNPVTDAVNIVSVPRDTLIEVEDAYDAYGNYIPYWKINSAYALGGEEEVVNQIENLLDIQINYMVEINYQAFRSIIDAIGGVDMYIDRNMYYDDDAQDLHINFTAGETVHLDGKKAEEFIRWRKNNDGTGLADGDLGRISNQQKFIKEVFKKIANPLIVFDIPDVMNAVKENVVTNMSGSKIISYALKIISNSGVNMSTLQGYEETIYGQSFLVVEKENNQDIINALHSGSNSMANKREHKILVLNGTETNGLASNFKNDLEKIGYKEITIDNGEATEKSIIISKNKDLLQLLKDDTGINKTSKDIGDYQEYDAVIILGEDYN